MVTELEVMDEGYEVERVPDVTGQGPGQGGEEVLQEVGRRHDWRQWACPEAWTARAKKPCGAWGEARECQDED